MNARQKGRTFERHVARTLEEAGFQVRGLESGGDHLVVDSEGRVMHGEAKAQERLQLWQWLVQQERDCPTGVRRFLVFKRRRSVVYVVEPFEQFVQREAELAQRNT